jgi:hypothetical protein
VNTAKIRKKPAALSKAKAQPIKSTREKANKVRSASREPTVTPPTNFEGALTEEKCNAFKNSAQRKKCLRVTLCRSPGNAGVAQLRCEEFLSPPKSGND